MPPVASLSRVIEPRETRRAIPRRPVAQSPADQVAVAQEMTRQAAAVRTAVKEPVEAQPPTKHWYRREDPFTTAETDAAFAAFMAGDNPHLRTDEVPVVDFTSMIEKVGPDGRPVRRNSRHGSRMKLGLAALATAGILAAAAAFGLIEIPGADRLVPDMFRSTVSASTSDGSDEIVGETVDAQPAQSVEAPEVLTGDMGEQPLSIADGD